MQVPSGVGMTRIPLEVVQTGGVDQVAGPQALAAASMDQEVITLVLGLDHFEAGVQLHAVLPGRFDQGKHEAIRLDHSS